MKLLPTKKQYSSFFVSTVIVSYHTMLWLSRIGMAEKDTTILSYELRKIKEWFLLGGQLLIPSIR